MKVHVEVEMTPEEARKVMGLPDVSKMQDKMMAEMQKRMAAMMNGKDPDVMRKAWMALGGQGIEQFQRFMFDAASRATSKKDSASR
jgi:hypothetical protein